VNDFFCIEQVGKLRKPCLKKGEGVGKLFSWEWVGSLTCQPQEANQSKGLIALVDSC
jgi:hypothetical protein